jgi:hypothetical protein
MSASCVPFEPSPIVETTVLIETASDVIEIISSFLPAQTDIITVTQPDVLETTTTEVEDVETITTCKSSFYFIQIDI